MSTVGNSFKISVNHVDRVCSNPCIVDNGRDAWRT